MLITVDEAGALKKTLYGVKECQDEYGKFKTTTNLFAVLFFTISTIKSLVIATVIVSMFNQQPDLLKAWNDGSAFAAFLGYLAAATFFRIVDIIAPIAVIIGAFASGGGIGANFTPFVLPLAITYAVSFGLIFMFNSIFNSILENSCPKIYRGIERMRNMSQMDSMFLSMGARNIGWYFDDDTDADTASTTQNSKDDHKDEDEVYEGEIEEDTADDDDEEDYF